MMYGSGASIAFSVEKADATVKARAPEIRVGWMGRCRQEAGNARAVLS